MSAQVRAFMGSPKPERLCDPFFFLRHRKSGRSVVINLNVAKAFGLTSPQ